MADFIRLKYARNRAGEVVYFGLNGLLPVALLLLVWAFDPPYIAYGLVLLSKWRIFALRPRFWWANIKSNLVDLSVGISVVALMYVSSAMTPLQIMLAVGYAAWLLVLKPRSGMHSMMLQAAIAQFVTLLALFNFSLLMPEVLLIFACWVVGYVVCRHVISNYEEPNVETLSAIWGLITAEFAWLAYRWSTIYDIGLPIKIPQIALVMLLFGYTVSQLYHMHKQQRLTKGVIRGMVLFTAIVVLLIFIFSPWDARI